MLFDDEEISGKRFGRKSGRNQKPILRVNARVRVGAGVKPHRVAVFVLIPMVLVLAVVLVWYCSLLIGRALYTRNDRFLIRHLEIKIGDGAVMTPELLKEYTQISKGMNLFDVNISRVRQDFLSGAPHVKSMDITRYLPNTLQIDVVERSPIACIIQRRHRDVAVDGDGHVFAARAAIKKLPAIKKYDGSVMHPGDRVDGMMLAAVQIIEACENPLLGLSIESIEVGNREYLIMRVPYEGKNRRIDIDWSGMGFRTKKAMDALLLKLSYVVSVLRSEHGRRISCLDATFEDRVYGR